MIQGDGGCPINVEVEGPQDAPVLMLSNSLGTNLHMWDDLVKPFTQHFRLLRYDRRGHGKSGVPKGPYSMDQFGRDVIAVLDALKIRTINWCGLSMGGMVGQWLGANASERIDKLILSNTSAYMEDKKIWNDRIKFVQEKGLEAMVGPNLERWFTADFRARSPQAIARMREMFVATSPAGYIACGEAIRDMDFRESNTRIAKPTLIIVGRHDPATPPAAGEAIHRQIKGSEVAILDTAHIANIEAPQQYADTVIEFLMRK
jgi:3-oxoadipate enol-lactonase